MRLVYERLQRQTNDNGSRLPSVCAFIRLSTEDLQALAL